MKTILTYGSLRRNEYNFNSFVKRYGADNIVYLDTVTIPGFELYSLGPYPAIKESTNDKLLTVDILEVSDEAYKHITNMEIGANYGLREISIGDKKATIYIYNGDVSNELLVKSGDWSNYLKNKRLVHD